MDSLKVSEVSNRPHAIDDFVSQALVYARQNATDRICAAFGPTTLRIEACGTFLSRIALDPLRHAATDPAASADLFLVMIDGKETGIDGPALNDLARLDSSHETAEGIRARRSTLTVNEQWNTRCFIDDGKRHAVVWFADANTIPSWVVYDQIRNVLHWLSHERDFGLFHAAALRFGDVGCLITGKSGSGKSTITAAAIARGFDSAGDDFVLIENTTLPRVHAVFDTIKLDDRSLARLPQFQPYIRNPSRRLDDKAIVHIFDISRDRIASNFPLHAILHARLTGEQESRIVRSAPSDAFRALAPSSLLLLRAQGKQVSANCAKLVQNLATYVFDIGSDTDLAVAELAGFLSGLSL